MILKEILNVDELSEYLGIKKSSLYSKVERKEISYYKIGHLVRFKRSDIDLWMEKSKVETLYLRERAKKILRRSGNYTTDIDTLVKETVAEVKGNEYTSTHGEPDRIRGLREEVSHGSL